MPTLLAVRAASPSALLRVVQQTWDAGDAVLPLGRDAPDTAVAEILASVRPGGYAQPHADPRYGVKVTHLPDATPLPPDTALVVTTSGSTGAPKGIALTHAALQASVEASLTRLGCVPGTPWLVCLPVHHVAGITAWLRSRALGAEPIVHDGFDVEAVAAAARSGPWVSLVPTQLARLLDAGVDVGGFAGVLLGGAAAAPDLLDRARTAGARVVTTYGMTETCGGCVYDGRPLDGVDVGVGDDGRLRIRGTVLGAGIVRDGAVTPLTDGDWFVTNDLGSIEDGRVVVTGRADDVIVSGGENVPAGRVARCLQTHPEIRHAVVVGRADPQWGEIAVAVVVAAGSRRPSLDALRDHVAASLPRAWGPRAVCWVDEVPTTTLGKPDRVRLAQLVQAC